MGSTSTSTSTQTQIGDDRISKLADGVLGHILSFLPAQDAGRAAVFSTRWRDVFASVHTISLDEPEGPIPSYDDTHCYTPGYGPPKDPNPPPPFTAAVTAALLARHRRVRSGVAARPLRADIESYHGGDSRTVDNWVSYALKQAGAELELDLRLRRGTICKRPYSLHTGGGCAVTTEVRGLTAVSPVVDVAGARGLNDVIREATSDEYIDNEKSPSVAEQDKDGASNADDSAASDDVNEAMPDGGYDDPVDSAADDVSEAMTDGEYDDAVSSESEKVAFVPPWELPLPEYTVQRGLFSCTALRSLRIGPSRLSPPASISLPSLEELLLTRVSDDGGQHMQRVISACPRLADLTLETCDTVTTLDLLDKRLRRLALRCCHNLASVAVDSSGLQAFEYRGTVPDDSFLTMRGGSRSSLTSCKVDICGEEVWSSEELTKLREFLRLFVNTKHLHLQSARLGSGFHNDTFVSFQEFRNLRHLEIMGCLPHDDATVVSAMSRILQHAPELEVLTLVFQPEPEPGEDDYEWLPGGHRGCKEREFLNVHHLYYNQHNVLDAPTAMIACLTDRVREINLVHYQGGRAQRTLAKFLLCNALVLDELYCGFVPGPLWMQIELRREIEGWAMNNPESRIFY